MRISDWSSDVCSSDLLDVRHARGRVEVDDIDWDAVAGAERVLLRTYEHFPHQAWDSDFTAIAREVIARLGAMGVRLIGTDAASPDPEQSKPLDAHPAVERKSAVWGTRVQVRVNHGGRRNN